MTQAHKRAVKIHHLTQVTKSIWYSGLATAMIRKMRRANTQTSPSAPDQQNNSPRNLKILHKYVQALNATDRENVARGLYPPQTPARLPEMLQSVSLARKVLQDANAVNARRTQKRGTEIRDQLKGNTSRYPAYYQQNFHFQTDGWLGDDSAKIYDTQVETLFFGTADTMRRMALAEISEIMATREPGATHFLDIGCGNGHLMKMVGNVWPTLNLTGLDLSPNYLEAARKKHAAKRRVDLVQGLAESMPFEDNAFDITLASYLFHELPPKVRKQVIAEAARVLKPGGFFIISDSLQTGDTPELDPFLKFFPTGFHEPFYNSYLEEDFDALLNEHNFRQNRRPKLAFLTKVTVWQKQPC